MPLYNEAHRIRGTVETLDDMFQRFGLVPTFVIQDDASTDDSLATLKRLSIFQAGRIIVEQNPLNRGHGPTVVRAYWRALELRCTYILHVDSDGEIDPRSIAQLVSSALDEKREIVIGVRRGRNSPFHRALVTRLLRILLLVLFGVRSRDVNSPVRIYERNALGELLPKIPTNSLIPHVLLTVVIHKSSRKFIYVPVQSKILDSDVQDGSTWRASRRVLGIPTKFLKFVRNAGIELVLFRLIPNRK